MAKYHIGMFLNNRLITGKGETNEEAIMDMVENSIDINGNWSPRNKWWQFWKKKYPSWVLKAFSDWQARTLKDVLKNISPEETPFYNNLKNKNNNLDPSKYKALLEEKNNVSD